MAVMQKMLQHTAVLPCLRQEWYPAPQESYSPQGVPLEGRLAQLGAPLMDKNTGVGCHFLLQGIFLPQGSNPHLPHCGQIL